MHMPGIPLFSMLRERMSWLNARQNLLSANVANADTPGYGARDLKPLDFQKLLRHAAGQTQFSGRLRTTDPNHIAIGQAAPPFTDTSSPDVEASLNGNSVSLEREMIKVANTQAQYQAASNLYAKALNMMRTAIGMPGG
jgi:flagellar basal-body rod protein FlgB